MPKKRSGGLNNPSYIPSEIISITTWIIGVIIITAEVAAVAAAAAHPLTTVGTTSDQTIETIITAATPEIIQTKWTVSV